MNVRNRIVSFVGNLSIVVGLFCAVLVKSVAAPSQTNTITTPIGPDIIGETLVGYDEKYLVELLGSPTIISSGSKGKTVKYFWTKVSKENGEVLFDGAGFPPEALEGSAITTVQCRHEFDVHQSGLITNWRESGLCIDPVKNLSSLERSALDRLAGTNPSVRYDSPDSFNRVAFNLGFYFAADEMKAYHQYFASLSNGVPKLINGRSPLEGLGFHMRNMFTAHNAWKRYLERIRSWRKNMPDSVGIALLEPMYWEAYAWHARGTGMANTTSETGVKLFRQRIKRAREALDTQQSLAESNPLWHTLRISLMLYGNETRQEILETASNSIKIFPNFFPIRFAAMYALTPKWGGSFSQIDAYINDQLAIATSEGTDALYTRLYWSLNREVRPPDTIFDVSSAEWTKMRKGFEKLESLYPVSFWIKQNFAAFACQARDAKTYQRLRPHFEEFVHPHAWSPPFRLETCDFELLTEI